MTDTSTEGSERLGRYELRYELASGGMAKLYLARAAGPAGFEKLVALKVIHPHLASDPLFVDMFLDEARLAALIDHPNVCSVFDFGEEDGTYYMAMEYLLGESLSRVARCLASTERSPGEHAPYVTRIIAEAADGLHAAHELVDPEGRPMEVVHRDVSPQNLFLTYQGGVKVVDFGIARARERLQHTSTGQLKGKLAYMSPEQLDGDPADRRADVWALGVCLWELLTLRRLFRRDTEAVTLRAVLDGPIPAPSTMAAVDPALDVIVSRALARDRDERYETAAELSADLRGYLATRDPVVGRPELARFARELMPADFERRTQLIAQARRPGTAPAAPPPDELTSTSPTSSRLRERDALLTAVDPVAAVGPSRTPSSKFKWALGLGLIGLLAFAVGALGLEWNRGRGETVTAMDDGALLGATIDGVPRVSDTLPVPADGQVTRAIAPTDSGSIGAGDAQGAVNSTTQNQVADASSTTEDASSTALAGDTGAATRRSTPAVGTRRPSSPRSAMRSPSHDSPMVTPMPRGATGRVRVVASGGWAAVSVNGRPRGRTPAFLRLPVGTYRIGLTAFGRGEPQLHTVVVGAGEEASISVRLSSH